jgi:DNA-binding transcriptional MerR regulator
VIQDHSDNKAVNIPDKQYFKIGEVCDITGVKQHVLRYWESEFKKFIRPKRASSKQRLYRRVDVENIINIKKLLKDEGFTIPGAKKYMARNKDDKKETSQETGGNEVQEFNTLFSDIKKELQELKKILEKE